MRKSRFSEEQIIKILKEKEAGAKLPIFAAATGSASRRSTVATRPTTDAPCKCASTGEASASASLRPASPIV